MVVWLLKGKVVSLEVSFKDSFEQEHAKFVKPYIERFGPPDHNQSMPIPMGPYRGQTMNTTSWEKIGGALVAITSNSRKAYDAKSYKFGIMMLRDAAALEEIMIKWEEAGLQLPPMK